MPRLLDTFSKAGGAATGYSQAGFDVYCNDIDPQRNNPFPFHQGDAIDLLRRLTAGESVRFTHRDGRGEVLTIDDFHVITGSPPCLRYSRQTRMHGVERVESHPDLVAGTRAAMADTGLPWVIENVDGAPLIDPVVLCGSMWGMERLRRHRGFESSVALVAPGGCRHDIQHDVVSVTGHSGGVSSRDGSGRFGGKALWSELMGIDWMSIRELAQAIPPVYTRWIGSQVMAHLGASEVAA